MRAILVILILSLTALTISAQQCIKHHQPCVRQRPNRRTTSTSSTAPTSTSTTPTTTPTTSTTTASTSTTTVDPTASTTPTVSTSTSTTTGSTSTAASTTTAKPAQCCGKMQCRPMRSRGGRRNGRKYVCRGPPRRGHKHSSSSSEERRGGGGGGRGDGRRPRLDEVEIEEFNFEDLFN